VYEGLKGWKGGVDGEGCGEGCVDCLDCGLEGCGCSGCSFAGSFFGFCGGGCGAHLGLILHRNGGTFVSGDGGVVDIVAHCCVG